MESDHVFHLLSVAQTGDIPVPAPLPAVGASTAQQEFSQVPSHTGKHQQWKI